MKVQRTTKQTQKLEVHVPLLFYESEVARLTSTHLFSDGRESGCHARCSKWSLNIQPPWSGYLLPVSLHCKGWHDRAKGHIIRMPQMEGRHRGWFPDGRFHQQFQPSTSKFVQTLQQKKTLDSLWFTCYVDIFLWKDALERIWGWSWVTPPGVTIKSIAITWHINPP